MRLLDKIALNKLITTILNFILTIVKMFAPKSGNEIEVPVTPPGRRRIFPIFRKKNKDEKPN